MRSTNNILFWGGFGLRTTYFQQLRLGCGDRRSTSSTFCEGHGEEGDNFWRVFHVNEYTHSLRMDPATAKLSCSIKAQRRPRSGVFVYLNVGETKEKEEEENIINKVVLHSPASKRYTAILLFPFFFLLLLPRKNWPRPKSSSSKTEKKKALEDVVNSVFLIAFPPTIDS